MKMNMVLQNMVMRNMAKIRCPDGVLRDYADYEDNIKPLWKEKMRKEHEMPRMRN